MPRQAIIDTITDVARVDLIAVPFDGWGREGHQGRGAAALSAAGFVDAFDPARAARKAVAHVRRSAADWWLHVDLDVVAQDLFVAQRVPGDEDEDGGLTWEQLTELLPPPSPRTAAAG